MIEAILLHASPKTIGIGLIAIYVFVKVSQWISLERKIRSLGGHAPRARTWLPWDLDFIFKSVRGTMNHRDLEVWESVLAGPSGLYNTIEVFPMGKRYIFTTDPENIKAILATQFTDYGKGEPFHEEWKDFLGDSIFVTDLDQWHSSRQLIRSQFVKDRVSDLSVLERHLQILMREIKHASTIGDRKQGGEVNIADLFYRYTLDTSTDFLLGRSVESLQTPEQEFAVAFAEVQKVQNIISRAGPLNYLVPRKTFIEGLKVIDEFVNPYIDEALSLSQEELATKTKSEEGYTFLHALAGFTRDRKVLRDQLVAVLLAGRDTTASTLSWSFYELARHPETVQKLREEIIHAVGSETAPTYSDLKSMKYLQHTINEILRIYPIVPFNIRMALKDTTLPRGGGSDGLSPIGILKDTPVVFSTLFMQRRADLYPPTSHSFPPPLTFNPERWETWQPKAWQYIPFNGGPRICIGQQFALATLGYTIVRLLQKFERIESYMERVDGGHPCLKAEIVLQPGQGVMVGFWTAKSDRA